MLDMLTTFTSICGRDFISISIYLLFLTKSMENIKNTNVMFDKTYIIKKESF